MHGLEKEYGDKMKFEIRPHDEGNAQELIAQYGFDLHGMVVTDATGAVHWKESGHSQTREGVERAITGLLDG